jgi:hypothetical protein
LYHSTHACLTKGFELYLHEQRVELYLHEQRVELYLNEQRVELYLQERRHIQYFDPGQKRENIQAVCR